MASSTIAKDRIKKYSYSYTSSLAGKTEGNMDLTGISTSSEVIIGVTFKNAWVTYRLGQYNNAYPFIRIYNENPTAAIPGDFTVITVQI